MRFRVERDGFAESVAWVARALPGKPQLPVLAGMRLTVTGDELSLSGYDFEVSSEATLPVAADEAGQALVSGRLLAEISRSLPGQPVDVRVDGSRTTVVCGSARFTLPTLPLEEYPPLPAMPEESGTVGADAFAAAVAGVWIAAGRDDTLPVLTGIRVEVQGDLLTMVATDRYRLALRQLRWQPVDPDMTATALVPARNLAEAARTLTAGAQLTVALATRERGEGMIGLSGPGRRTTSRLLDGEFPKYRSLLPTESAAVAVLDTAALVDAVKRVGLVASRTTPLRLTLGSAGALLEAGSGDDAQAAEEIDCSYQGEDMTVAFNPGYLLDGLTALDSDQTRLSLTSATKPVVITGKPSEPAGKETGEAAAPANQAVGPTEDYRYLLMPVRLAG